MPGQGNDDDARSTGLPQDSKIWFAIFEQMPVGVIVAEVPSGRLLWRNHLSEKAVGGAFPPTSSVADYVRYGALHEDGRPFETDDYPLAQAVLYGAVIEREPMWVRHGDGEVFIYDVSASRVIGPQGCVLAVSTFQDVTAERNAQRALREAAERVQLALDAGAIVGTWVWEVRENRFTADALFAQFFGFDPERCRTGLTGEEAILGVHPDDRDGVLASVAEALARGGAYRHQYRVLPTHGACRWVEASGRIEVDEHGEPTRFPGVLMDIEQRLKTERERDQALELLQKLMQAVPGVVYAKDLEGRMLIGNRGATALVGKLPADCVDKTDVEALADKAAAEILMATDRRIMDTGVGEQVEEALHRPDGALAIWLSNKEPLRNESGEVIGMISSSLDITAWKQAEAARDLLMREVDHCARNALAMVQTLVRLTDATDPARYRKVVAGRVDAMARAQGSLSRSNWERSVLGEVIGEELSSCAPKSRFALAGPRITLSAEQVQPLNMIMHELATNAIKFGALSAPEGMVEVSWRSNPEREVELTWKESGGPVVKPPEYTGFGVRLIERFAAGLGGSVETDWWAGGLVARLTWPAS